MICIGNRNCEMNLKKHPLVLINFCAVILILWSAGCCYAQPLVVEKGEVSYVKSYPDKKMLNKKRSFFKKINDVVFGSSEIGIAKPVAILIDSLEHYWILDQEAKSIFEGDTKGYKVPKFIHKSEVDLASLVSICRYSDNSFLVTDSYLNKVFVLDPKEKKFYSLNDSLAFLRPTGIVYSPLTQKIWVAETGNHRLQILDKSGRVEKTIGTRGVGRGEFNFPTSMAIDNEGNVYVVDAMNFRIEIFNKEGEFLSMFGENGDGTGSFASPKGIALDSYNNIYVVDALFNVVQIFDKKGNFLYNFGSQGQGDGQFWMPSGIFIDKNDHIFIADTYNSKIQEFQLKIEVKK